MRALATLAVLLSIGVLAVLASKRNDLEDWRAARDERRREMFI
jgi:hypothetical protein